jgi:superfamily II DNA or RNA helicase
LHLDPSYRLQTSWNGQTFFFYLRSLVQGVLTDLEALPSKDYLQKDIILKLPDGKREIRAYNLGGTELVELLLTEEPDGLLGGDALWLQSVVRWVLSLYKDGYWYPQVLRQGHVELHLLLDSTQVRQQYRLLEEAMPPSALAAYHGEENRRSKLWRQLLSQLSDAIGWKLLRECDVTLPTRSSGPALPERYHELIRELLSGQKQTTAGCAFFDNRQASLTLEQRISSLALKLVPPTEIGGQWQIRPQLQSIENPEVSVDALDAWAQPSSIPTQLIPTRTTPRLHLLREFGRALRLFPVLGASLASTPPSPLVHNDEEMAQFLKDDAQALRSYGYDLLAPEGLRQASVPDAALRLEEEAKKGLDLHQLLDFQWELVVQDRLLDQKLLEEWMENPSPLFYTGSEWLWLNTKKTMKLLRFVEKQPRRGTLLEAMQFAAEMPNLRLDFQGSLAPLNQTQKFTELAEPERFHGTLRDYQRRGFSWLGFMERLGLGACLADDMGLGKTIQTLALLCELKDEHRLSPTLLVCPTSVLGNWQREAERFAPDLRVKLHHGDRIKEENMFAESLKSLDVLLTSYSLLTRDSKLFLNRKWQLIILDEAQQIKNPSSKVSKLTTKLESEGRLILTGTPVENRLQDLWTLFRFLQPELLGSKRRFGSRFATPIERRGDEHVKTQLKRLVGPFILRRTKMDPQVAAELPARVQTQVECSLTPEQAKLYEAEVKESLQAVEGLDGFHRKGAILRLLTRLKQLCNHPALLEEKQDWSEARSGKLHRLFEILKELAPHEGVLIFSQFTKMLKQLKGILTRHFGEEVLLLDGSTPRESRDQMVERFQSGIGPRLFCISLKAGGVGLNLTRASSVVHFDRWWNPAVEAQATDRAHRIGQRRTVQVFKFVTMATLEEQIARIIEQKQALMEELIEEGDGWLTELNNQELSQLLLPQTNKVRAGVSQ